MYPFKRVIILFFASLLLFSGLQGNANERAQAQKASMFLDMAYLRSKDEAKSKKIFDQANACLLIVYIEWIESMIYLTGNMSGLENENSEFSNLLKQKKAELSNFTNASPQNKNLYSAVKREVTRLEANGNITGGKKMSVNDFSQADFTDAEQEFSLCLETSFINSLLK